MIVDFEYVPLIEDFNSNGTLKLEAILKILENSGNKHSDLSGDGILQACNNGTSWVLTDWYVKIDFYPKYSDKIVAKTWSEGFSSPFGTNRDFELYCNDKLCAKGTTKWFLLDINSLRPVKITKELLEKYKPEDKCVFEEKKLPKIQEQETFVNEVTLKTRRCDIDFNNHVHNLVYLDYAMEVISEEAYNKHNFEQVRISYKSAVKKDEEVSLKYSVIDKTHTVLIYSKEELKALVELKEF